MNINLIHTNLYKYLEVDLHRIYYEYVVRTEPVAAAVATIYTYNIIYIHAWNADALEVYDDRVRGVLAAI